MQRFSFLNFHSARGLVVRACKVDRVSLSSFSCNSYHKSFITEIAVGKTADGFWGTPHSPTIVHVTLGQTYETSTKLFFTGNFAKKS